MNAGLYALTIFSWGTSWLAVKLHLGVVAPEVSLFYRFALAATITAGLCFALRKPMRFSALDHLFMAMQGVFLFSANFFLIYLGMQYLTSGLAAVVFSTVIVMNIFGSAVLFRARVEPRSLLGAACGLSGLSLVFWPEIAAFDLSAQGTRGLLLSLGGTVFAACGMLTSAWNQARRALPVFQTNAYGMAYGATFTAFLCLLRGRSFDFDPTPLYAGSLLHLAIFSSVLGFWSYLTLVGRIGVGRAAYVTALFPLLALALSTVFENYTWSTAAVAGIGLILLGNIAILVKAKTGQTAPKRVT